MRKLAGVLLMSVFMGLVGCGGGQKPTTKTYTSADNGATITIPATVGNLTLLTGQGGTGSPASEYYVDYYSQKTTTYNQRNDQGGVIVTLDGGTTYHYGTTPDDYCGPTTPYTQNGVTNYTQTCYDFTDLSYWDSSPATTGPSTTMTGPNGFSRTWAGGLGGPASATTAENVAVVPGGQYVLNIPAGGSITMSYFE